jgi:hypothetical protein
MTTPFPLGRLLEHDERSRAFPAPDRLPVADAWHHRYGRIFDQGNLGSCTGNAMAGWLMTGDAFHGRHLYAGKYLTERNAVALYELATVVDGFPGTYPPDDSGSSGLGVAKAAKQRGYITGYTHAFGIDHARSAIQTSAFIVGSVWTEDMFTPDADGFVEPTGAEAGGHEYECVGYADTDDYWLFLNSWGNGWGTAATELGPYSPKGGAFRMTSEAFAHLLDNDGDVTVPTL